MKVWILTYNDLGLDGKRGIFGVYHDEDSANDELNDKLLLPLRELFESEELLWDAINPDITEHEVQ